MGHTRNNIDNMSDRAPRPDDSSNDRARDKSPYNLRPRKAVDYREVARVGRRQDTEANVGSARRGRGRKRSTTPASRRGSTPRAGASKRASRSRSASRSRGASRSGSATVSRSTGQVPDVDVDETDYEWTPLQSNDTLSTTFSWTDKDFYPINFDQQDVVDAMRNDFSRFGTPAHATCSFDNIGGLAGTIETVRKTIRLPLMCPQFFSEFAVRPKKGLIFYGPPGVGKTMTARALVEGCNCYTNRKIAFFLRKGSDILNPYVGQSEANLTKLFDAAKKLSPSIIFLDEFDALAHHRTQNVHTHAETNVVSTLLALMDGLEDRGMVFVIAATNRLDSIDPAFRRPGRFDLEIRFELPDLEARKDILSRATSTWKVKSSVIDSVAKKTDGFNGADLACICAEAAVKALERANPDLANCEHRDFPDINVTNIPVKLQDFDEAMRNIQSSSERMQEN